MVYSFVRRGFLTDNGLKLFVGLVGFSVFAGYSCSEA